MKDLLEKSDGSVDCYVESAATSDEEIVNGTGNPVYPPAQRILAEHGISCRGKRARQLAAGDYDRFDMIIGMDQMNLRNIRRICGCDDKTYLLMDFALKHRDVADPWYTGDFEATWNDVSEGCKALLEYLKSKKRRVAE